MKIYKHRMKNWAWNAEKTYKKVEKMEDTRNKTKSINKKFTKSNK